MSSARPLSGNAENMIQNRKQHASSYLLPLMSALALASCGGSNDSGSGSNLFSLERKQALSTPAQAQWSPVKQMTLSAASAANLPDGNVVLWAADSQTGFGNGGQAYTTVYNPVTGTFTDRLANESGSNLFCPGTTNLPDGKLIVNGGSQAGSTSVYDPVTNRWSAGSVMKITRGYNANTLLQDGSVFTIGGSWSGGQGSKNGEVWTPAGGWKLLSNAFVADMVGPDKAGVYRGDNHMWLLPTGNGKVLHAGPSAAMHWIDTRGNGAVTSAGLRGDDPYAINGNTVMYDIGKILKTGGATAYDGVAASAASYVIDVNAGVSVRKIAPMAYSRGYHNSVVLPNGQVVVIGGQTLPVPFSDSTSVLAAELFDPATETFTTLPAMASERNYHSVALLLPDATVMSAGGQLGGPAHKDMQILKPHYLFNADGTVATRPVITTAPASVNYGATVAVNTNSAVTAFSLVRASSTTHTVNNDQRRIPLSFTTVGTNSYNLSIPSNPGWALPGYYMLFAMNANGVPSVAKMVQISNAQAPQITPMDDQFGINGVATSLAIQSTNPTNASLVYGATGLPAGLSINAATGAITGTATTNGNYRVNVSVSNGAHTVSTQFLWTVASQPAVGSYRYVKLVETSEINGNAWGSMAEFNVLDVRGTALPRTTWKVSVDSAETGAESGAASNAIDGNPATIWHTQWATANPVPTHWYVVDLGSAQALGGFKYMPRAGSGNGTFANYQFYASNDGVNWGNPLVQGDMRTVVADATTNKTVLLPNIAPTMTPPANQVSTQGQAVNLTVIATDLYGGALSYSASGLPNGLSLNASTGLISGTASTAGTFNVTVTATNTKGFSGTANFSWAVAGLPPVIAPVSAPVITTGSTASYTANVTGGTGTLQYSWNFGDGSTPTAFSTTKTASHAFAANGVYTVTLTVKAADGSLTVTSFVQAVSSAPTTVAPVASTNVLIEPRTGASSRVWVVNQDNDSVSVFDAATNARLAEIAVGNRPRTLALAPNGQIWVANKGSGTISMISLTTLAVVQTSTLARGSQPFGLIFTPNGTPFVALEALGQVVKLNSSAKAIATANVGANPRHLAATADGSKLLVSRFITPAQPGEATAVVQTSAGGVNTGGEVVVLNPATMAISKTVVLQHSNKVDRENQSRGVPNYLGAAAISPDGQTAWIPSKQDNIQRGTLRDGNNLDFQDTVRAISSRINLGTLAEDYPARVDHDNSGIASAAVYHPNGAYLFVALQTSRHVAVMDAAGKRELIRWDVGRAPEGVAVTADGKKLFVSNFMDRSVSVFDLTNLITFGQLDKVPAATVVKSITTEKLTAPVLLGKQLFYDARDPRLARDAYLSCASCHNDGGHDGRTWDFTGMGEGLRNTISLRGRAGGDGNKHWTGNFDEIQDFEGQIRNFALGSGLMTDAQFNTGTTSQPLGSKKAGLSTDLDALAAYVASLNKHDPSPLRTAAGALTNSAAAGKTLFVAKCASCHNGASFANSANGALFDVGTIKTSSGKRLNGTLTGIDTPTLRDIAFTAPYLHDGSAATVEAAITAHTKLAAPLVLTSAQLTQVADYVRQIGSDEAAIAPVYQARYIKLLETSEVNGNPWGSMAEFNVLNTAGTNLPRTGWKASADSAELAGENGAAANAIDGNVSTIWHTQWVGANPVPPHWFTVDMGSVQTISGFKYLPRSNSPNGTIANYSVYLSNDGVSWGNPVNTGDFRTMGAMTAEKTVVFAK